MSIPSKPAVVRPVSSELNQFIDKLDKSSSKTGATSQIHAEKNKEGEIIFSRATASNKNAGTVSEHLKLTTQRQTARDEIKRLLKDSGIEITADIKKAMPSLTRGGDANTLKLVLQSAVTQQEKLHQQYQQTLDNVKKADASNVAKKIDHTKPSEVKDGFQRELDASKFESGKTGTYLRNNSPTAEALAKVFTAAFTPIADSCSKAALDATLKSLKENKDPDLAMKAGYQALLDSLSSITLPVAFTTMCLDMAEQISNSADKAIQDEPGRAEEIRTVADTFKNTIVSSLFLRVLTNQITVTLMNSQQSMNDTAAAAGVELKPTSLMQRLAPPLLALINGAKNQEKNTGKSSRVYDDHPDFKNFVTNNTVNNLENFTAYQQLNAQIRATNSTASS